LSANNRKRLSFRCNEFNRFWWRL